MKPKVYIETSVIGYLTSRPSRDLLVAARQQITRDWWESRRDSYDLFISQLVVNEAGEGDPTAAQERLAVLKGVALAELGAEVRSLAARFVEGGVIPGQAVEDSLHIAVAVVGGMDYLLTWNCTHIANAHLRKRIVEIADEAGYECPIICTPQEMMEPGP